MAARGPEADKRVRSVLRAAYTGLSPRFRRITSCSLFKDHPAVARLFLLPRRRENPSAHRRRPIGVISSMAPYFLQEACFPLGSQEISALFLAAPGNVCSRWRRLAR